MQAVTRNTLFLVHNSHMEPPFADWFLKNSRQKWLVEQPTFG